MENPIDIVALDAEVVKEFGWTSAFTLEELYSQIVNSYINLVLNDDGFWGTLTHFPVMNSGANTTTRLPLHGTSR